MRLFLLLPLLFLLSCTAKEGTPPADLVPSTSSSSSSSLPSPESSSSESSSDDAEDPAETKEGAAYSEEYKTSDGEDVRADVVGNGKTSLLFFAGESCVSCTETAEMLKMLYAAETFPFATYALDFEQTATLREQYGVTVPDTLVLLDGEGQALQTVISPSEMDLRYLLATR